MEVQFLACHQVDEYLDISYENLRMQRRRDKIKVLINFTIQDRYIMNLLLKEMVDCWLEL